MLDALLKNALLVSGERVDLAISDGLIVAISASPLALETRLSWNLEGCVLSSGFVDAHVHLDKTLSIGEALENETGSLLEAIERWHAIKPSLSHQDYLGRARKAAKMAIAHGTTAMRSHIDIDENGLTALEAMLELKEELRGKLDLQLVALGHVGVSTKQTEMMAAALAAGADLVGGAPALAPEPAKALRLSLDLAERYDKAVDLHIDETDDPDMATLELLAEETLARGLQGQVMAGHCVSLMAMPAERATAIIDKVAKAELHIVSLPAVNLVLQGRADTRAVRRGATRIKEFLQAGVNVSVASDNVRDPFNPFGNYDLLWLTNLTGHVAHMTGFAQRQELWQLVSQNPAKALGLNYGLLPGSVADLVVFKSRDAKTCLADLPGRKAVLKRGEIVSGSLEAA